MLYALLKWLHILSTIALIGAHASYGIWIVRAPNQPDVLRYTYRTIKWIDGHIAGPAYGILLITGLAMGLIMRGWLMSPWLHVSLGLVLLVLLTHVFAYAPALRRLIRLLDSEGTSSPAYVAAAGREKNLGITMTLVMVAIVFLMVVKPELWG